MNIWKQQYGKKLKSTSDQVVSLTSDELNAMQYACGYVPHKLLERTWRKGWTFCRMSRKHGGHE